MAEVNGHREPVFKVLGGDDDVAAEPTVVESVCPNCFENGLTKLLLVKIPYYKDVIIMSFKCESCGNQNSEVQSGDRIEDQGIKYRVRIENARDLSRQVVTSDHATISVPEIELEILAGSQKGSVTTVEGVLDRTVRGLCQDQPVRRAQDPEGADKIDEYVKRVQDLRNLKEPFHVIIDDPSGHSFVENPLAPSKDPNREVTQYTRTKDQDHKLAIYTEDEIAAANEAEEPSGSADPESGHATSLGSPAPPSSIQQSAPEGDNKEGPLFFGPDGDSGGGDPEGERPPVNFKDEVIQLPANCPNCNAPAFANFKIISIPHFKEVVLIATVCDFCGFKTNEVKSAGGIEDKGTRITLKVTDPIDLSRDLLKAECCTLEIPELDLEVGGYALGGRFTTLEGILANIQEQIQTNPFYGVLAGDSATDDSSAKLKSFLEKLDRMKSGQDRFTIILDDPTGNSYLQNVYAPEDDPEMTVEKYERTHEQNEELGLNDMKVVDYETEKPGKSSEAAGDAKDAGSPATKTSDKKESS